MSHIACHASAPQGHKCADCTMSGVPCPECYRVHWTTCYPLHETQMSTTEMDLRMLVRYFLRQRVRGTTLEPLRKGVLGLLELHNFDPNGEHNEADVAPKSPNALHIFKLVDEVSRLNDLINSPEVIQFMVGVQREQAHQRVRWGSAHDREKSAEHWYWLVGYLGGKALRSHIAGDLDKAKHHTISSAAALYHWHTAISEDPTGHGVGRDADLEAHDNGRQAHETAPIQDAAKLPVCTCDFQFGRAVRESISCPIHYRGPGWVHTAECSQANLARLNEGVEPDCICGEKL